MQRLKLEGQRFGRLTVIGLHGISKTKETVWLCECECGKRTTVMGYHLRRGDTQSCGCLYTKHGASRHTEHAAWANMVRRCTNTNAVEYAAYGGRGVKVCDRWLNYDNFIADMGKRPLGTSLDRIDNNGDYTPENCKWSTPKQQARNKRNCYLNRVYKNCGLEGY